MSERVGPISIAGDAPSDAAAVQGRSRRVHKLVLRDLVVHRYFEEEVLLRRADRIAHEVIKADLRDGEYYRQVKHGVYALYLPKLTPDAGQLRVAVIGEKISREIRGVHPGSIALDEMATSIVSRGESHRKATPAKSRTSKVALPDLKEHRRQATQAMKLMSSGYRLRLEELLSTAEVGTKDPIARFEPIWDISRATVSAFRCVLDDFSDLRPGVTEPTELQIARIDALTILQARAVIQSLVSASRPCLVIAPVHLATLQANAYQSAYIEAMGTIPERHRGFLVLEILGDRTEVSRYGLRHVLAYLHNRCRAVLFRADIKTTEFSKFTENRIFAVGVPAQPDVSVAQNMIFLNQFADAAKRTGMRIYATGVPSKSLLLAAVAAGFDFASGAGVVHEVDYPFGVCRATLDAFYRDDQYRFIPPSAAA
ncbi:MAG: hypothetical protein AB7E79_12475 [Rhodospirillaceae bacterium]